MKCLKNAQSGFTKPEKNNGRLTHDSSQDLGGWKETSRIWIM